MQNNIHTPRLTLRPLVLDDAADMTVAANDIDVAKWLTRMPHPYVMADAEVFILGMAQHELVKGVFCDNRFAGVISNLDDELGYWFSKLFWGQGIATEAVGAFVDAYFASCDQPIKSGYLHGNAPSARVLSKLGFLDNGFEFVDTLLRGRVQNNKMTLTIERWQQVRNAHLQRGVA